MTEIALVKSLADIERDKEVKTLSAQAIDIGARASVLAIVDDDSNSSASEMRLELQRILKALDARRKFFTDPHNQFVKLINNFFATPVETATAGWRSLGGKMVKYSDDKDAAAKVEEARILADKRTKPETKSEKLAEVPVAPKVVRTETGSVSFRIDKQLRISDENLIPREYLYVNEPLLKAALKSGKVVPGAHLEDVKVPVGRSAF